MAGRNSPVAEQSSASLRVLYEEEGLPSFGLPPKLAARYGGDLGFVEPGVYANLVASLDGVVALGSEQLSSGSAISGCAPADRFVMGLLRACADAVLIGAGTLRADPGHLWTPEHVWPASAADFAELRHFRGRPEAPELVVVTARGALPTDHPALANSVVVTTAAGARRLAGLLPPGCTLMALTDGPALRMTDVLAAVSARGHAAVLTEGGPRLLGQLVADGMLDELFLTVSPVLAGRGRTPRPGLISGRELLPAHPGWAELVSVRQHGSHLFLRHRLGAGNPTMNEVT